MKIIADNIISSYGLNTMDTIDNILNQKSSLESTAGTLYEKYPTYISKISDTTKSFYIQNNDYTEVERMILTSIINANTTTLLDLSSSHVCFVFSSTKGEIDLLDNSNTKILNKTASSICQYFKNTNAPIIVSNACTSGMSSLIYIQDLFAITAYEQVVLVGYDLLSDFVLSGFQSLAAISDEHCLPFDRDRKGINMGEACATMIISKNTEEYEAAFITGCITNDSNHISGPSRTGEELAHAITKSIENANIKIADIACISAHGTATSYNDGMESKAFHIAKINNIPTYSLKGYVGHTLGAAGVIETIVAYRCLQQGLVPRSLGCTIKEVDSLNITTSNIYSDKKYLIKTSSGFGGCNAIGVLKVR